MKILYLSIVVIFSVTALGTSTVHSSYSTEFNATMDKMYYNNTDTAHVIISGPPSTPINLAVIDSSSQQKLATVVHLDPNGSGIFSFNLASFTDGIYYAMVGQGYDRVKIGFGVGIFPAEMGGVIQFTLPKYDYAPNEIIKIQGFGQPDSIVRMDLIDPYGVSENSTQVTSDGSGKFWMEIGVPSSAVNGTWNLSASSGVNHRTLDIVIHSSSSIPPISYPSWIKNNAKLWSEGSVDNSSFVQVLYYLIENEMKTMLPEGTLTFIHPSGTHPTVIPSWIKNDAGWWASGKISDKDFVNGIYYLLDKGIIRL